ncbi:MAG TPA: zf-HC2 domain-containing protein [Pyrinomonadaceae bacterium]|nr:zf-HC2 domain-containing protein [Pyrinomonadaceae bacterium]
MNCEKCQELLSDFLDGTITREDRATFDAHLEECMSCAGVRDDLGTIVSFCRERRGEYASPPNERAMWLRIRNLIESERDSEIAKTAVASNRNEIVESESLWSRLLHSHWDLSLPQLAASIIVIAILVSLATGFGVRRWQPQTATVEPRANAQVAQAIPNVMTLDERTRDQQLAIDYWNRRIEDRRARWSQQMRDAFDHNLNVLDQAVADQRQQLKINPHDEISEEMLNDALNEKIRLLREFSDL